MPSFRPDSSGLCSRVVVLEDRQCSSTPSFLVGTGLRSAALGACISPPGVTQLSVVICVTRALTRRCGRAVQSDGVGGSAVGVVARMSARRSAWSSAWLRDHRVRRRRRSPRAGSPVT